MARVPQMYHMPGLNRIEARSVRLAEIIAVAFCSLHQEFDDAATLISKTMQYSTNESWCP